MTYLCFLLKKNTQKTISLVTSKWPCSFLVYFFVPLSDFLRTWSCIYSQCVLSLPPSLPPISFLQRYRLKMSGSLWNSASVCPSSAPSSTVKCVERSPRTDCAAKKGKNLKQPVLLSFIPPINKLTTMKNEFTISPPSTMTKLTEVNKKPDLNLTIFVVSACKSYSTQAESYRWRFWVLFSHSR